MALSNQRTSDAKYVSILNSDGKFHLEVTKETEGAKLREYETSDGKTGSKWELSFDTLEGMITAISFRDGDYGEQLYVGIDDVVICMNTASPFAEDFMKKLPNIDKTKPVKLQPYAFDDKERMGSDGKPRKIRGITIMQEGAKIENHFWDAEKKKVKNGAPKPEGDTKNYKTDDWKIYFLKFRKFLTEMVKKNHLIEFKKLDDKPAPTYDSDEADKMVEEMNKHF